MRKDEKSSDAVSPVVGVMLMLVVTIIIAAVVSAFAGGLADSSEKTPQLTFTGTYSQENGMTITHGSGDAVALSAVNFMTTPSAIMGTDASKFAWIINKTIILDPENSNLAIWNATSGIYNTTTFAAGDTLVITHANCIDYTTDNWTTVAQPNPGVNFNAHIFWEGETNSKSKYFGAYAFGNPKNAGKYFYLDLVDTTGSIIARALVTITG